MRTTIAVSLLLCSFAGAQTEHWMADLGKQGQVRKSLLDRTQVTGLQKRINAAHEPSGDAWINTAWAVMLMKKGIVPPEHAPKVAAALSEFWNSPKAPRDGDARTFQGYFTKKLGAAVSGNMTLGRTLPTARMEIPVRKEILRQMALIYGLQEILLEAADKYKTSVMPGYTHNRHAQPTTLGHYLMSVNEPIQVSMESLEHAYGLINRNRLGCGALAGTSMPIDRDLVSAYLGMDGLVENTNYGVGCSDGYVRVVADLVNIMAVLSRMAIDFDFWSSNEYDLIDFGVGVGSFMMPQKWAERSNQGDIEATWFGASKILGNMAEVTSMGMKVPHGDTNAVEYHMKDGTLAALKNIEVYATPWTILIATIQVHEDKMLEQARAGYSAATELAYEIMRRDGLDYRTAHDVVQTFVYNSVQKKLPSSKADIGIFQAAAQEIAKKELNMTEPRLREVLDPVYFVNATNCRGGVAPKEVARMIADQREKLAAARLRHQKRIESLENAKQLLLEDLRKLATP